jgi:calcineurin-like phosphoesterase family protein
MAHKPRGRKKRAARNSSGKPRDATEPTSIGQPVFAQPKPTADPTKFRIRHASDDAAYRAIDALNAQHKLGPMPFPAPRGGTEPVLTLAGVLGKSGPDMVKAITKAGQLVFHAVGDTGSTRGPENQSQVADKMVADFDEEAVENIPHFFFHLGDVIYSFGESRYYYDQFYEPYRDYPAPIVALAGNHDGMVAPGATATSLAAFIDNFCASDFEIRPEAGGLSRTAQIQPGVFFTFEAPLIRIIALYSNVLEDPGVIASPSIGNSQLDFLEAALTRAKGFSGALILAHHHPIYTLGSQHGWSTDMLAQIDKICAATGVWPHAVLTGHAHNYQRFTRVHQSMQIPYIIAGNGGHAVAPLKRERDAGGAPLQAASASKEDGASRYQTPFRAPTVLQPASAGKDLVRLENYDDQDYGYLRVVVTKKALRIEYHPASDTGAAKTPDDVVAVDLASRTLIAPNV